LGARRPEGSPAGDSDEGDAGTGVSSPGRRRRRRRLDVREAAITLLARRDHSRSELERRLLSQGYSAAEIAPLISELIESRALDDARFAHNYVSYHVARGQGPIRIRMELEALGVAAELIETVLTLGQDWLALAQEQRSRRFGPKTPASRVEQLRQARFLQSRGFSSDHIRAALGADFEADS
jgi:regulatory protein